MPFFQNLPRVKTPTYFFFPTIYAQGLRHFLEEEKITGWDIATKQNILPLLPPDVEIPTDIRLTPTAPRVEKRISCMACYFDRAALNAAYQKLLCSQEWLDWHNGENAAATAAEEYRNAKAQDPSPISALRTSK